MPAFMYVSLLETVLESVEIVTDSFSLDDPGLHCLDPPHIHGVAGEEHGLHLFPYLLWGHLLNVLDVG